MVLETLGKSLNDVLKRLMGASVVDEELVKEIVRDIQRALLQADVNVELVLAMTENIEKRALREELPPGIPRREHVIKVLYDELAKFLGGTDGKPFLADRGHPLIVMMVGIQGSGKCVTGDSTLTFSTGGSKPIEALFNDVNEDAPVKYIFEDGEAVPISGISVVSVNPQSLKIEHRPVEYVWRLKAPSTLMKVTLASGDEITTTPEHPFFVYREGHTEKIRADHLMKDALVLTANNVARNDEAGRGIVSSALVTSTQCCLTACLLDPISVRQPNWVRVVSVVSQGSSEKYVYDLTVKTNHTFIANNIVVHNTTTTAKLAKFHQKRGMRTAVICADTFRLGAYDQLKQLSESIAIDFYGEPGSKDPVSTVKKGLNMFLGGKHDLIIVDTAGRHKDEKSLIAEMQSLTRSVKPNETVLVIDGTLGQQAAVQARAFHEVTPLGSIIVTKLDGTAKGGGALSAVAATGAPIRFIGTGERIDDLELFRPTRFVGRLLGMGDIQSLIERVKEAQVAPSKDTMLKFLTGKFTLDDFYTQMINLRKMGPLKKVLGMMGLSYQLPDEMQDMAEDQLDRFKSIIQSMTPDEKSEPAIINASRAKRIGRGSGTTPKEVRTLVKQYEVSKKTMKRLKKVRSGRGKGMLPGFPGALGAVDKHGRLRR